MKISDDLDGLIREAIDGVKKAHARLGLLKVLKKLEVKIS